MVFLKSFCCAFLASIVVLVHAETPLTDFSGAWRSYFHGPSVNVLTPQGPALLCHDTLSSKCNEEMTPTEEIYTFNGTTIAMEIRNRVGITTNEQSAEAHPECAKDGVYPVEVIVQTTPSQITSYDAKEDRLYFIDPRRPDDVNCLLAGYRIGENGPYLEVTVVELYKGSVPDVFARGLSFRCDLLPKPCNIKISNQGELDLALQASFNMTCIAGDCLNKVETDSASASCETEECSM